MELKRIQYGELTAKQKEIYNFQKVSALLADYGFNCIKLDDDWQGADFLAYHKDGEHTLKVQLKGRLSIAEKYRGKGIHMAFPISETGRQVWYLIPHDILVKKVGATTNWLNTDSWKNGKYSSNHPNKNLTESIREYAINSEIV